jgi:hypothetical protein
MRPREVFVTRRVSLPTRPFLESNKRSRDRKNIIKGTYYGGLRALVNFIYFLAERLGSGDKEHFCSPFPDRPSRLAPPYYIAVPFYTREQVAVSWRY